MSNTFYKVFSLVSFLVIAGFGGYTAFTTLQSAPAKKIGTDFFASLHEGHADTTYELLDVTLKQRITREQFAEITKKAGLEQFEKVEWKYAHTEDGITKISGRLISDKGFETDTELKLIKREGAAGPVIYAFEVKPREDLAALKANSLPAAAPAAGAPAAAPIAAPATAPAEKTEQK